MKNRGEFDLHTLGFYETQTISKGFQSLETAGVRYNLMCTYDRGGFGRQQYRRYRHHVYHIFNRNVILLFQHGVGVEFVRFLPETNPPTMTNVFCELGAYENVVSTRCF